MARKKVQKELPVELETLSSLLKHREYFSFFQKICRMSGIFCSADHIDVAPFSHYRTFTVTPDNNLKTNTYYYGCLVPDADVCFQNSDYFVWFSPEGDMWRCKFNIDSKRYSDRGNFHEDYSVSMSWWEYGNQLMRKIFILNSKSELGEILRNKNPYSYEYAVANGVPFEDLLMAPELEQLQKAGFSFAYNVYQEDLARYYRLVKKGGTSPKNLFKTSKAVYTALKDEPQLRVWDTFRKMDKTGKLTKEQVARAYEAKYDCKDLDLVNSILNRRYNGKPVFTFDTLQRYLERVNVYEAIDTSEALQLLHDYLLSCESLDIRPRTDSDSLKREHDVAARSCRQKRDEVMKQRMDGACDYLKQYDYEEGVFFIRGIRDYDDLIDEARQQRNCVASYASYIISGRSMIYVMRKKSSPNTSLITVELTPDGQIRQSLMACNRPIHNSAQSSFLSRWQKFVRKKMAGNETKVA